MRTLDLGEDRRQGQPAGRDMSSAAACIPMRVRPDDPDYARQAAAEAAYWHEVHPCGLEATEDTHAPGPVDRYLNQRFTGDGEVCWYETIRRHGTFREAAVLGTSSLAVEERILATNPTVRATFFDLSGGPLTRRHERLAERYPGRVETRTADLNFVEFPPESYDLIVSSSTIHHVTNLEHLAAQINRTLTPEGSFFLDDYVGEPRFQFSAEKRRVYDEIFNRDRLRQGASPSGVVWLDASDLSPMCGVRSDEILPVFRTYLREVELHTAGALLTPLRRSRPADDSPGSPWVTDAWVLNQPRWRFYLCVLKHRWPRVFGRLPSMQSLVDPHLLEELALVGDVLADAGLLLPCQAYAVYRKR
jgi:SAM-dependent methyltransferase